VGGRALGKPRTQSVNDGDEAWFDFCHDTNLLLDASVFALTEADAELLRTGEATGQARHQQVRKMDSCGARVSTGKSGT